ncbi:hypothetical protein D3C86_1777080 [compost metagenome]
MLPARLGADQDVEGSIFVRRLQRWLRLCQDLLCHDLPDTLVYLGLQRAVDFQHVLRLQRWAVTITKRSSAIQVATVDQAGNGSCVGCRDRLIRFLFRPRG